MRLLVLSKMPPLPTDSGGRVRLWELLRRVATKATVDLICFGEMTPCDAQTAVDAGIRITCVPEPGRFGGLRGVAHKSLHSVSGLPTEVSHWLSEEFAQVVAKELQSHEYDLVQSEFYQMLPHLAAAQFGGPKCATVIDIGWVPAYRSAELATGVQRAYRRVQARRTKAYELDAYRRVDSLWVMSALDRDVLMESGVNCLIGVVPNGVDTVRLVPPLSRESSQTALFVGSARHEPNRDALAWYLRHAHDLVRSRVADYRLSVVGMSAIDLPGSGADEAIDWHGRVESVEPYYNRAGVSIAPIRVGGGTRIKILEAMAVGCPVVSTGVGTEGIDASAGRDYLRADDGPSFADAVVRCLTSDTSEMTRSARLIVERGYSWDGIADEQMRLYGDLLQRHQAAMPR